MLLFVDLVFPVEVDKVFTYTVPLEFQPAVKPGTRALAPFGKRKLVGFVVNVSRTSDIPNLKAIFDILDDRSVFSQELFQLTKWISEYYFAPWGEVLKAALPPGFVRSGKRTVSLTEKPSKEVLSNLSEKQAEIIQYLLRKRKAKIGQLQKVLKTKSIYTVVNALAKLGYVNVFEEVPRPSPKLKTEKAIEISNEEKARWKNWKVSLEGGNNRRLEKQIYIIDFLLASQDDEVAVKHALKQTSTSLSTLKSLNQKGLVRVVDREKVRSPLSKRYDTAFSERNVILTGYQQQALEKIRSALHENQSHTFLLHGVTGSGKTQVYIEAIREVLASGKSAIVLVPEISLTPQIVRRFTFHFGEAVTVLHSRMSAGERYDTWRLTREGKYKIIIGPRSAVFAPAENLGLIVVDEEQEATYKQFDQSPRYHARDVAVMRAYYTNAVVILGSATPSVESYYNALQGKYTLLELPERVDNAKLPHIEIIDMTSERRKRLAVFREERKEELKESSVPSGEGKPASGAVKAQMGSFSDSLKEKILERLAKKEGIIILQNRRGFAPFVECDDCGFVEMCDNCNVTLTYHLARRHLRCHYCGFVKSPPDVCPKCGGFDIHLRGIGTQRVEEELKKLFAGATLARMDLDTTTRKGSHDIILRRFAEGNFDILLGTQMVAKGLDFPRVTLVGVISADTQMLLPDFRSAERTFQLLTQVAGRAGRSEALVGEVIIQTSQPQHYSLKYVRMHNFQEFYREELEYRKELDYPPYSRLVLLEMRGEREVEVMRHAERFASLLQATNTHYITLGPAPAAIPKLKGKYRWHILLKNLKSFDASGRHLHRALRKALHAYQASALGKSKRVELIIDVDPVGMM